MHLIHKCLNTKKKKKHGLFCCITTNTETNVPHAYVLMSNLEPALRGTNIRRVRTDGRKAAEAKNGSNRSLEPPEQEAGDDQMKMYLPTSSSESSISDQLSKPAF